MNEHKIDFTEEHYREILRIATAKLTFIRFDELNEANNAALWRHDVDVSPQRALALANIEIQEGVKSTFFFMLSSAFYNILEPENIEIVQKIANMGHAIGIHFDPAHHTSIKGPKFNLEERLLIDARSFKDYLDVEPKAFSFHNPDIGDWLSSDNEYVGGLVNAYSKKIKERFEYCSDSNGYWRFRRLHDVVTANDSKPLHVLTHPEWWTADVLSPRDRIQRSVDGRRAKILHNYDEFLASNGRLNIR